MERAGIFHKVRELHYEWIIDYAFWLSRTYRLSGIKCDKLYEGELNNAKLLVEPAGSKMVLVCIHFLLNQESFNTVGWYSREMLHINVRYNHTVQCSSESFMYQESRGLRSCTFDYAYYY